MTPPPPTTGAPPRASRREERGEGLTRRKDMTNLFDLSGKVALVTGGSRGLGYQMVKAFAAHGADVVITSRKLEACEKVAAEVKAMGRTAVAHACNVSNWAELDGLADAAYRAFG